MAAKRKALNARLERLYTDVTSAAAYGGVERLLAEGRKAGIKNLNRNDVVGFLRSQNAYTLHKPLRKRFAHNPIVANNIDHQWEADLVDMSRFSRTNKGNTFLLTVVDVLSKYAWVVPVKRKSAKCMRDAFEQLFKQSHPRTPKRLHTDHGNEFLNREVQTLLKQKHVHHFSSHSDYKAAIVERFNRTLKDRMWRYFTHANTHQYLNVLQGLVRGYNNSFHRSIGMRPADVKRNDVPAIWRRLYSSYLAPFRNKRADTLSTGDSVRLVKSKTAFRKGYMPGWTDEIFVIDRSEKHPTKSVYKLKDGMNEKIEGSFYSQELQRVAKESKHTVYKVEKILKRRTKPDGTREFFVKWQGYPAKFNRWIKAKDFVR